MFAIAQRDGETTSREKQHEELEASWHVTCCQCLRDKKQMIDCCICNRMEGKGWWAGRHGPVAGWNRREMLVEPQKSTSWVDIWRTLFLHFFLSHLLSWWSSWGSVHPQSGMESNKEKWWENGTKNRRRDRSHQMGTQQLVHGVTGISEPELQSIKEATRRLGKKKAVINILGPVLFMTALTGVYQKLLQTLEISLRRPQSLDTYGIMIVLILSRVKILQASATLKSCL